METSKTVSEHQIENTPANLARPESMHFVPDRVQYTIYALALATSISTWFLALRSPLWLDETFSFWQIKAGFWQIMARRGNLSPAYAYILWLTSRITGTSEIGLRVPTILAMLAAVYLLYRAARELFDRESAIITLIVFCVHPIIVFASIDARPYAFGALPVTAAILMLVRLRGSNSDLLAAAFGIVTASIAYFQLVFGAIFPVLAVGFLLSRTGDIKSKIRQVGIAFCAFALAFLPNIPDLLFVFHGRQTLVFHKTPPTLADFDFTIAPMWLPYIFVGTVLVAAATRRLDLRSRIDPWRAGLCASLGLIPLLILYVVSVRTPTNVFVPRYRLVAIPGIALAWGWILSRIDSRLIRVLFCVVLVAIAAYAYFSSPFAHQHEYTWKYSLDFVEKNASADNATVLICSDFPNADYVPMPPSGEVKENGLFTPLSYYKLSVPVVGLPRALNDEAMRVGSAFVQQATTRHERFLAIGYFPSYDTLRWLRKIAAPAYDTHVLTQPDGVAVIEFKPRQLDSSGVAK